MKYLVREPSCYELNFRSRIGLVTSRSWQLAIDNYLKKTMVAKEPFFRRCIILKNFNDIDLCLSILMSMRNPKAAANRVGALTLVSINPHLSHALYLCNLNQRTT
jgi:hypothetical protein